MRCALYRVCFVVVFYYFFLSFFRFSSKSRFDRWKMKKGMHRIVYLSGWVGVAGCSSYGQ